MADNPDNNLTPAFLGNALPDTSSGEPLADTTLSNQGNNPSDQQNSMLAAKIDALSQQLSSRSFPMASQQTFQQSMQEIIQALDRQAGTELVDAHALSLLKIQGKIHTLLLRQKFPSVILASMLTQEQIVFYFNWLDQMERYLG